MRIQHNIMAMNAYRNYSSNSTALSKNLEKLSSGYKINRAGDDAAGLAISEKMRAQISGLDQASSNAKSGINLVQTAEGSLTEVHDMLNRMVTLSDESANGTYDNETDRGNLQKEVSQLKSEINRIADSSNFNGIKLLDGSLSASGASNSVPEITGLDLTDNAAAKDTQNITFIAAGDTTPLAANGTLKATINYQDADGNAKSTTLSLAYNDTDGTLTTAGGKSFTLSTAHTASAAELATAFTAAAAEDSDLSSVFKVSDGTGKITLTAKTAGANTQVVSTTQDWSAAALSTTKTLATVGAATGADAYQSINFAAGANAYTVGDTFTVGGQKFAFVASQADAVKLGEDGVNSVVLGTPASGPLTGDVSSMQKLIEQQTGYAPTIDATNTQLDFKVPAGTSGTGGLKLQIGDTAESFNQLTVSVGDMHAKALGIGDIDISTQAGATSAMDKIKSAINSVSSTRGNLGALQNRLDHTINNLGVMTENIQDAESTVRDTDVASEMMAYTKNNILVQSAQAMLAQANQVPQGVLQLLQ